MLVRVAISQRMRGPHQQDVRAEFPRGVEQNAGFDLAAEGHQQGGEGHGKKGEDDERECDQPLFHQSPDFRQLVTAAETFHPGDHDAGGGPQRQQRSGDQQAHRALRRAAQEIHGCIAAGGKDAGQRVGDLAHVRRAFAPGGQHRADHQQRREKRKNRGIGGSFGDGKGVVLEGTPEGQPQKA